MPLSPFVITSECPTPGESFRGYAFFGNNLIVGQEGYDKFRLTGGTPESDADGCYLHVTRSEDGSIRLSTDFRGYYPLFYYSDGDNWAVSPSLSALSRCVANKKWKITPREHQIEAFRSNRAMTLQLTSQRTVFNEVYSLPYDSEIVVSKRLHVRRKTRKIQTENYAEALRGLVSLWASRLATVIKEGMNIRIDLSGGVDSRTILSLLLASLRTLNYNELVSSGRININSQPRKKDDYEIATLIADQYGLPLNIKPKDVRAPISGGSSLNWWEYFNVGRYSPHILPVSASGGNTVQFPGVGGEEHRPFYEGFYKADQKLLDQERGDDWGSFINYLKGYRKVFSTPERFEEWVSDIVSDLDAPPSPYDSNLPVAIQHYRRHRGRHHSSKNPEAGFLGVIFGSRSFYECTYYASLDDVVNNQVLFDVMFSCDPNLAQMPYDKESKAPNKRNIERATIVPMVEKVSAGKVFRGSITPTSAPTGPSRNMALRKAVEKDLDHREVQARIGPDMPKLRKQLLMLGNGNLHQQGTFLHYAALIRLVVEIENHQIEAGRAARCSAPASGGSGSG